ncbi:MAG: hypothetical protein ACI4UG_00420 [Candidatus Onthovivens sp.]
MNKKFLLLGVFSFALFSCNNSSSPYTTKANIEITSNHSSGKIYSPNEINISRTYHSLSEDRYYNTQVLPSTGDVNLLVIPVTIPGNEKMYTNKENNTEISQENVISDLEKAFFGKTEDTGFESVSSFYEKSSYGKLKLSGTVTPFFDIVNDGGLTYTTAAAITLSETLNVVDKAVEWAKNVQKIDLTKYDNDKDGYIDGVWLIYSAHNYTNNGPVTDDYNYWAYTYWGNQDKKGNVNDPIYNLFGWASYDFMYENYGYGKADAHTYIHEMGHFLGLSDYYSDDSKYNPVGKVDMMDGNIIDHNSYSKMVLGWTKPYVALGNGTIELSSMQNENALIVIPGDSYTFDGTNFDPFGEYVLVELYTNEGLNEKDSLTKLNNERPLAMNDKGVRIYHIDNRLYYVDKSDKQHIFSVPYENQKVDETHRLVNPISNQRGVSNPYISLLGVDVSTALYDEIRLIEATNKDTFSSGGYQMNKTLFKEGSTFSLEKYKTFFQGNDDYSFNNGDSFTSSLKIEGIY